MAGPPSNFPDQFGAIGSGDAYKRVGRGDVPTPVWTADPKPLTWNNITSFPGIPPVPGFEFEAVWKSPLFDLRPDLRSSTSVTKVGIPIWDRAARLYVQFLYPPSGPPASVVVMNLTMFSQEFANVVQGQGNNANPSQIVPSFGDVVNQSAVFSNAQSAILGFSPFNSGLGGGDGYPVRFWYLKLFLFKIIETGLPIPSTVPTPPEIDVQAAMY
jgi:hypothetical protein